MNSLVAVVRNFAPMAGQRVVSPQQSGKRQSITGGGDVNLAELRVTDVRFRRSNTASYLQRPRVSPASKSGRASDTNHDKYPEIRLHPVRDSYTLRVEFLGPRDTT